MDFSYILRLAVPNVQKLFNAGFLQEKDANSFTLKKSLSPQINGFFCYIYVGPEKITVDVYEEETGEKYALLDVAMAKGEFVGEMRSCVRNRMEEIRLKCFDSADLKSQYEKFLCENFTTKPDFPWKDTPDYAVFRCKNGKWFALVMKVKFSQLGLLGDGFVWVVNLKADTKKIPEIIDKKSIFPAWHMNKKYWITVLLTAVTDFSVLCKLTEESFSLVCAK